MQAVLKENLKLVNRVTQSMLLTELTRRRIPLKDVRSIEIKQRWQGRDKKDKALIDFLMKRKKKSAIHEEKVQRRQYWKAKKELYEGAGAGLRLSRRSRMAVDFRKVQKQVISKSFQENVKENRKKIKALKEANDCEENNADGVAKVFGVKVGDQELDEHKEKPANVWGGSRISTEAKQVLNLGKKFRLQQKLDSIATKTEIEKGLTIIRWKERDKDDAEVDEEFEENEELLNVERKLVDLSLKKATDMKFNRRLYAPNAAPEKLESNLQQTREALEEVFEDYKKERTDDKGNIRESNLTDIQRKGLRELKEMTRDKAVIMPTDKTMGLSVEPRESYKAAAEVHIKDDIVITEKARKQTESEFNALGKAMIRFLKVGKGRKHDDRIKEAMLTENVMFPPLSLYGKDHKPDMDAEKGPKRRPVVSANEGPNARVSDLAAEVLNKVADAEDSKCECLSTEALQAEVEALNRRLVNEVLEGGRIDKRTIVVGSLDFKAWYPSLKKSVVVPTLRKRLEEGPASIEVDEIELARLLFILMDEEEIASEGLENVIHTMRNRSERKPKLTDQEIVGGDDFRTGAKTKLNPPKERPNNAQKRKMIALAMSLIVEKVMANFLYTFAGQDRRQSSGGPIGDVLTQAIARHMGNEFDQRFKKLMEDANVKAELYQRYADDIDLVTRSVGRSVKFCPLAGKFVSKSDDEIAAELNMEEDEITMKELKHIADTIMENIETECDYPSAHPELNNKVPVLDLAMWVTEVEISDEGLVKEGLHSTCDGDQPCLPIGSPPHLCNQQPCAPPANRGHPQGGSINNSTPSPLTQPSGSMSQSQVLRSESESGPHLAPGCCNPGRLCPLRSGRCTIRQSQPGHLATRTSETSSQDVGLHPPVTNYGHSGGHPSNPYAPPAYRGGNPGGSDFSCNPSVEGELIQPSGSLLADSRRVEQVQPERRRVQQVRFEFFSKPCTSSTVIMASSAQPWGQKRTTLTQELIRRLLNCSKELDCQAKRKHLNNFMQLLKNSGYDQSFRAEILKSGLQGYNKIVAADKEKRRPMYRTKQWKRSDRWLEKRRKKKNWLGPFWKSCIFVPPTPGSELKKRMQRKEQETRVGGREGWPIKIIETAGRTLEQTLVNNDPFQGNACNDPKCVPSRDPKNKINCRRNTICYRVTCRLCLRTGMPANQECYEKAACYYGQSGKNAHCRCKEHVSKFNSKTAKTREESAFYKHLMSSHGGKDEDKEFDDYFEVKILKAYKKPFTMCVEEGTYIANHRGELLNSKSEWHQPKLIRTTTTVVQGGADSLRAGGGRAGGGQGGGRRLQPRDQSRARGQ